MAINVSLKALAEGTAEALKRFIPATITGVPGDAKTFPVARITDLVVDDETLRDWFLYIAAKTGPPAKPAEWRRVDTISGSNIVCVQNFVDNVPVSGDIIQLYSILTPDEWRTAVKLALGNLSYEYRLEIPLETGKNLYTPTATWLQSKGQIQRYIFRDVSSGATNIYEESAPVVRPIENANGLSFYIPAIPLSITNVSLFIVARRPYDIITADGDTTTCPLPLIRAQAKWEALMLIREYLGSARAKQLYGMTMVVAEQELAKAKARWMPTVSFQEPREEEAWEGVDTGWIPTEWSW